MSVPTYDKLMLPLLHYAGDNQEHHIRATIEALADRLSLSQEDREQLLPSGQQRTFDNRVHWARTYLVKAELLENVARGIFRITARGLKLLENPPPHINRKFLMQYSEFVEFQSRSNLNDDNNEQENQSDLSDETPRELIHSIHLGLQKELAGEVIDYVLSTSPAFFERMVVELLLAMGYGGALGTGQATRITNDGGIDGIIQEDKLGLDMIYIQAKRWAIGNSVGRPDIQNFAGSLAGEGALKGVFITTSHFTKSAIEFAERVPNYKIILIDGTQLARLMIEHNIGVSVEATYVVKKVDRDYFNVD